MESHKIQILLEKYFEGETSLQEEKELKHYFSSANVAPEFIQYRDMFGYFEAEKTTETKTEIVLQKPAFKKQILWMAASIVLMLGIGLSFYNQQNQAQDLGSFDNPEIALQETQKALNLIAENLNKGKENIFYLQEYEYNKNRIFKN